VPFAWPTGLYLVVAAALLWGLEVAKSSLETAALADSKSLRTALAFNVIKGLRDTTGGMAVGLMLVSLAQTSLETLFPLTSDDAVLRLEKGIESVRSGLGWPAQFLPSSAGCRGVAGGIDRLAHGHHARALQDLARVGVTRAHRRHDAVGLHLFTSTRSPPSSGSGWRAGDRRCARTQSGFEPAGRR